MADPRKQQMFAGFDSLDEASQQPVAEPTSDSPPAAAETAASEVLPPTGALEGDRTVDDSIESPNSEPEGRVTEGVQVEAAVETEAVEAEAEDTSLLAGATVYAIDAHSLIYQVFHAMPEMTGPSGQPVGAVQGFVRDMLDLIENRGADYIVAAFDHPTPTFRHLMYDQYKEHRDEMPGDLQSQIPLIQSFLDALGIRLLSIPGVEADDVLATLAKRIEEDGGRCLVVTSDKDCRQLITDRVQLLNLRKGELFDDVALMATWGIRPNQVVDFQSLVGDSVDNVPGVPLIGPKIAQELLAKYDTLENVLDHADEVSGTKRKENLKNFRDQAFLSRELVRLKNDVPFELDWPQIRVGRYQVERVLELCRECGFRQLATRIEKLAKNTASGVRKAAKQAADKLRRGSDLPPDELLADIASEAVDENAGKLANEAPWEATYKRVESLDQLRTIVDEIRAAGRLVIDTETTSVQPRWAEIVGYSFCYRDGEAWYLPIRGTPDEQSQCLDATAVADLLRPVLEDPSIAKIGQNIKYDMVVLRSAGIELRGAAFDTMVADYLIDPGERSHNLDELARRHLAHTNIKIDSLIGSGKKQKRMDEVPLAAITDYAAEDALVPWRLTSILEPRLTKDGLETLFHDLEMPLVEVLAELEHRGIKVDRARLQELSSDFSTKITALEEQIYEVNNKTPFNIDSRLQLAKILFEDLKLPILKKTKTGPSMDAEVLEDLARLHPLPAKVLEYRHLAKLRSTYVDSLQELIHPETMRVHTSLKQDVAATGRLSSQDPNLQNIPVRTAEGRAIRSAFQPGPEGWKLMAADYSQIELRVLAHFSGDATLADAFANDRDIHTQVASQVYEVPANEVTSAMRRSAKAINFGVIYGQSPFGLARSLGISNDEAASFITAYFAQYPGVDEFMRDTLITCRKRGYVTTIAGRRRPVSGVRDPHAVGDKRQRTLPERIAINTVIQGSAADIIKRAMITVHRRLKEEKLQARMLLQIHDELLFEFPPEEQDQLRALVVESMSTAEKLSVPLKIDVKTGLNWADCEPLTS